jgi:hypothetical protein
MTIKEWEFTNSDWGIGFYAPDFGREGLTGEVLSEMTLLLVFFHVDNKKNNGANINHLKCFQNNTNNTNIINNTNRHAYKVISTLMHAGIVNNQPENRRLFREVFDVLQTTSDNNYDVGLMIPATNNAINGYIRW